MQQTTHRRRYRHTHTHSGRHREEGIWRDTHAERHITLTFLLSKMSESKAQMNIR